MKSVARAQTRRRFRRLRKGLLDVLVPSERSILTREGFFYFVVSAPASGRRPVAAGQPDPARVHADRRSVPGIDFRRPRDAAPTRVQRRVPAYVLLGRPAGRRLYAGERPSLDCGAGHFHRGSLVPVDRVDLGLWRLTPRVFFPGLPAAIGPGALAREPVPARQVSVPDLDWAPGRRSGLVEQRVTIRCPTRSWSIPGSASSPGAGTRCSAGDREPAGPAPRPLVAASGISRPARLPLGRQPAVDSLADLRPARRADGQGVRAAERAGPGDPDRPLAAADQGDPEQREAVEQAISFAATVCLETCRHQGRRLVLGWTGPTPGVGRARPRSSCLHELLEQLAVLRPASEGGLAELFDVLPPSILRESLLIIVSTPAGQPGRGGGAIGAALGHRGPEPARPRGPAQRAPRATSLPLFQTVDQPMRNLLAAPTRTARSQERQSSQEHAAPRSGIRQTTSSPESSRSTPEDRRRWLVNSYLVYRASFYLMLIVATMVFSGDSTETPFLRLYPARRRRGRASWLSSRSIDIASGHCLADWPTCWRVASLSLLYFEYKFDDDQLIRCLGHWLVYLATGSSSSCPRRPRTTGSCSCWG